MDARQLFFIVQRSQHSLSKLGDRIFQQLLGISAAHLSALFFLSRHDGCLLKDLSSGLELNNSAVTGLVRRMEAAELVVKHACSDDGRASRVVMTERGRSAVERANPVLDRLGGLMAADFTEAELETVVRFLATIVALGEEEASTLLEDFTEPIPV